MDAKATYNFLFYALSTCAQASRAFEQARELASTSEAAAPGVTRYESRRVFDALRLGLQATAGVSRIFWPAANGKASRIRAAARATILRSAVGLPIDPSAHVLGSRVVRNFVEHMDEHLDVFLQTTAPDYVFDEFMKLPGTPPGHPRNTLLSYDGAQDEVLLLGRAYPLHDVRLALGQLSEAIGVAMRPYEQPVA